MLTYTCVDYVSVDLREEQTEPRVVRVVDACAAFAFQCDLADGVGM